MIKRYRTFFSPKIFVSPFDCLGLIGQYIGTVKKYERSFLAPRGNGVPCDPGPEDKFNIQSVLES